MVFATGRKPPKPEVRDRRRGRRAVTVAGIYMETARSELTRTRGSTKRAGISGGISAARMDRGARRDHRADLSEARDWRRAKRSPGDHHRRASLRGGLKSFTRCFNRDFADAGRADAVGAAEAKADRRGDGE